MDIGRLNTYIAGDRFLVYDKDKQLVTIYKQTLGEGLTVKI